MLKRTFLPLVACAVLLGAQQAQALSDAAEIGANAGAMSYCRDKFADKDTKSKYKLLKLKTYGVYDDLDGDERAKALILKNKAEDGDYLGKPLSKDRCDSLRKMLYLKYKD